MKTETIVMTVILELCAAAFIGIGIWAFQRHTPMPFWSGSTVKPEEIRDIPAYNRACGCMWTAYGALWALSGLLAFQSISLAGALTIIAGIAGLPVLVFTYNRIYRKYRR